MKDIDFHQLFIITKYGLLQEIRHKRSLKKKRSYINFIFMLLIYFFSGIMMGSLSVRINDSFSSVFFSSALFMILMGNFILLEFPTLITGPDDFSFYSSLPVTSATYFSAKILIVLVFVGIFSICYTLPVMIIIILNQKFSPGILLYLYPHFSGGIIMTLLIINLYGILLRFVRLQSLRRFSVFLNFFLFFLLYAGYFFLFRLFRENIDMFILKPGSHLILFPNAWGSAVYIPDKGMIAYIAFGLSFLFPIFMLVLSRKIISLDFAEKIAEQSVMSVKKKKVEKRKSVSLLWHTFEEKAIALLIKTNFKYDVQFKLSILTIIPLTILYFVIVLFVYKGSLENPFDPAGIAGFHKTLFLYVAIGFFPFYIKTALSYSQQADASWLFFTTPYNRLKLVFAARKFVFIFFLFPYFLVFFVLYVIMAGVFLPVVRHFLVVIILAFIQTNIFLLFMAEIPFSKKPQRGRRILHFTARMAVSILLPVPLLLFVIFFYSNLLSFWVLVFCLLLIAVTVEITGRKKAQTRLNREEFLY